VPRHPVRPGVPYNRSVDSALRNLLVALVLAATLPGQEPSFRLPDFSGQLKPRFEGVEKPIEIVARLESYSRSETENPAIWYALSKAYEALGLAALDYLGREAPQSEYWVSVLGYTLLRQGRAAEAEKFYQRAIEKAPKMRGLRAGLAEVYRAMGKTEEAARQIEAEEALGKPDCVTEKFACLLEAGRWNEIIDTTTSGHDAESLYYLIQAAMRLTQRAAERLDELPESVERHARDADRARREGNAQGALAAWQLAAKMAPGNVEVQTEVAIAHLLAGDGSGALQLAEELVKKYPGNLECRQLYGELLASAGRVVEAIPHLEQVVAANPKDLSIRAVLGRCYVMIGDTAKAIPHLEAALPTDTDGSIHIELSVAHRRAGNNEKADEVYQWYLEKTRR
jgi:predicted Zn-dependent protease